MRFLCLILLLSSTDRIMALSLLDPRTIITYGQGTNEIDFSTIKKEIKNESDASKAESLANQGNTLFKKTRNKQVGVIRFNILNIASQYIGTGFQFSYNDFLNTIYLEYGARIQYPQRVGAGFEVAPFAELTGGTTNAVSMEIRSIGLIWHYTLGIEVLLNRWVGIQVAYTAGQSGLKTAYDYGNGSDPERGISSFSSSYHSLLFGISTTYF